MSQQETTDMAKYFYRASAADFMKIPGNPVAYWASETMRGAFSQHTSLSQVAKPRQGLATTDNEKYLRLWHECSINNVSVSSKTTDPTWYPCQKGGGFRKWYGNNEYVVNWKNNGEEIKRIVKARYGSVTKRVVNEHLYFQKGLTWSSLSSGSLSMRYVPEGFIFETKGSMCFFDSDELLYWSLGFLNSAVVNPLLKCISPTLDYHEGPIGKLPICQSIDQQGVQAACRAVALAKADWDSNETSWDFSRPPLFFVDYDAARLEQIYRHLRLRWSETVQDMRVLEEGNNRIFIDAYCLEGELTPEVPQEEITLSSNPHFRYGSRFSDKERESLLQCDTYRELVSYAVGCMMGRYSVDKPGLILASQGDTLQDYLHQIPSPRFAPDDDAILPLTDQEWFADDATNRLRKFIRVVWGDEHLQENLDFVAESLCLHAIKPKRGESALDTIRRYLSTQFYKDHLRTYKKRPIYWLFSSGKHKAFECLVYLHRYNEGTLARMRTEYVIPLSAKLHAYAEKLEQDKEASTSAAEAKRLEKEIATLHKQQIELAEFDEKLRHFADQRISLDLDDGVKVNYARFGELLAEVKAVTGEKPQ
jgi:hypothetical protein